MRSLGTGGAGRAADQTRTAEDYSARGRDTPPGVNDALIVSALSVVPKNLFARWMGAFARTRLPDLLRRSLLRWYVGKYKVNLDECEGSLEDYPTLVDFFTRALKPGVRPLDRTPEVLVSPVDATCYVAGKVKDGRLPQAGALDYAVADLLGGDRRYEDGDYAVLYLSPKDYHRVHSPRDGQVRQLSYLPGRLWPVFPAATRSIRDLFARNERLVVWLETDVGEVAVVMVGAFGVGRMRTVCHDVITNVGAPGGTLRLPTPRALARGEELGRFEMGSTVILVFPPGTVRWTIAPGDPVRLGAPIGTLTRPA